MSKEEESMKMPPTAQERGELLEHIKGLLSEAF
jgi:hypothetical protein